MWPPRTLNKELQDKLPADLDEHHQLGPYRIAALDDILRLACCAGRGFDAHIEPRYDLETLGNRTARVSRPVGPDDVAGHADQTKMRTGPRKVYDQMPEPRYGSLWRLAANAAAITTTAILWCALRPDVPRHVYVAGCPSNAEACCTASWQIAAVKSAAPGTIFLLRA